MESPFRITVYDKGFDRTGWIGDPVSLTVTPRHNAIGTAELVVPSSHSKLAILSAPGARLVIDYRGEQIISGPVRNLAGQGPRTAGQVTVSVEDDLRLLWRMFGYATPGSPADSQPNVEDKRTGPAETVAKGFVAANAGRWPQPITVAPDLGRGTSITVATRMVPLADKLYPAVDTAGIGLTVRQVGAGLEVDAYVPAVYPRLLTEEGGTVTDWEWSATAHQATRAIVGGPNTGTSREFKGVVDAAREALTGDIIETFVDAGSVTIAGEIIAAGTTALADAGPKSGFKVTLSENAVFTYGGGGVHVGDRVSIQIGDGVPAVTDVLREATLSWSRDTGLDVTPTVGDRTDDPDRMIAALLAQLARGIRDLRTR